MWYRTDESIDRWADGFMGHFCKDTKFISQLKYICMLKIILFSLNL